MPEHLRLKNLLKFPAANYWSDSFKGPEFSGFQISCRLSASLKLLAAAGAELSAGRDFIATVGTEALGGSWCSIIGAEFAGIFAAANRADPAARCCSRRRSRFLFATLVCCHFGFEQIIGIHV